MKTVDLKTVRRARGYTLRQLARQVGVTEMTLSRWERGATSLLLARREAVLRYLGLLHVDPRLL